MDDPVFLIAPLQLAVDIEGGGYSYGRRLSGTRRDLHNIQEGTYLVYKTSESESEEEIVRKKQKKFNPKLSKEELEKLECGVSFLTSGKLESLIQEVNNLTKEVKFLKEESNLYGGRRLNRNLAANSLIEYGLQFLTIGVRQIVRSDPKEYFGGKNVLFSGYIEDVLYSRMVNWIIKSSEDRPGCGTYTLAGYWSKNGYEGYDGFGDEWLEERETSKTSAGKCQILLRQAETEFGKALEPNFTGGAVHIAMGLYVSCLRHVRNEDVHSFGVLQIENSNTSHKKPKTLEQQKQRLEQGSKLVYRTLSLSSLKGKTEILQDVVKNLSSLGTDFEILNPMLKALAHHWQHVTLPNLIATTVRKGVELNQKNFGMLQYTYSNNSGDYHFLSKGKKRLVIKLTQNNCWLIKKTDFEITSQDEREQICGLCLS